MLGKLPSEKQQSMWSGDLSLLLDPNHRLVKLTHRLPWSSLEESLAGFYAADGRPSIPLRVMCSLILLQRMFDLSDERVVEEWVQNPYWQFFSGMTTFQWKVPCDPSELVRFRKRIGPSGCEQILKWTIAVHAAAGHVQSKVVVIDSTVQEKNITTPRDHKLYRRVAERVLALAAAEQIRLRRTYRRTIRQLVMSLRTANFPRAKRKAKRTTRRLRTIAGALRRDLERKLGPDRAKPHEALFAVMDQILTQKAGGPDHVYALHEPHVYCVAKGKDHRQFEFGTKATFVIDPHSGVILSAMNHAKNIYDGRATDETTEQMRSFLGVDPNIMLGDQGYRGEDIKRRLLADGIELITPIDLRRAGKGTPEHRRLKRLLRKRALIEPVIGHLKSGLRLCRNYLHGWEGDENNVLLAAAGWNLRKLLRFLWLVWESLRGILAAMAMTTREACGRASHLVSRDGQGCAKNHAAVA